MYRLRAKKNNQDVKLKKNLHEKISVNNSFWNEQKIGNV